MGAIGCIRHHLLFFDQRARSVLLSTAYDVLKPLFVEAHYDNSLRGIDSSFLSIRDTRQTTMSATYSGEYMDDRVYNAASPSPLEQEDIDRAIAASLAPPGTTSGFESPDVLPSVATADDNWAIYTQEAVLKAAGPEAGDQILQQTLLASAERGQNDNVESGPSADSHLATTGVPRATQSSQLKPWTITHMVEDMVMRLAVDLPLLNDSEADTLVFM